MVSDLALMRVALFILDNAFKRVPEYGHKRYVQNTAWTDYGHLR